ncbi:hypothetical protein ACFFKJ_01885 [Pelagicoccus mobilis]
MSIETGEENLLVVGPVVSVEILQEDEVWCLGDVDSFCCELKSDG